MVVNFGILKTFEVTHLEFVRLLLLKRIFDIFVEALYLFLDTIFSFLAMFELLLNCLSFLLIYRFGRLNLVTGVSLLDLEVLFMSKPIWRLRLYVLRFVLRHAPHQLLTDNISRIKPDAFRLRSIHIWRCGVLLRKRHNRKSLLLLASVAFIR